jgi:DNA modification methylase
MNTYYQENDIEIYNDDNLNLLQDMPENSVNLIYCDVLYNTGKIFTEYSDNLGTPKEAVEWYRPRIEEMHRVLASNGSIFIHCNWRLDSYLRILMDDVFGGNCFRNRIYRKHSEERGFFSNFDSQVDIILYYVKDPQNFVFNEIYSHRPILVPLYEDGYLEGRSKVFCHKGVDIDLALQNKHWLISEVQFNKMVLMDEVKIIEGLPYRYTKVKPIGNLWNESEMLDSYSRKSLDQAYDTPKPEAILERILNMCSNPGDTVADFFLGGGTTAVVVKKLGRKGIFCDISERACNVTVQKLLNLNNS